MGVQGSSPPLSPKKKYLFVVGVGVCVGVVCLWFVLGRHVGHMASQTWTTRERCDLYLARVCACALWGKIGSHAETTFKH